MGGREAGDKGCGGTGPYTLLDPLRSRQSTQQVMALQVLGQMEPKVMESHPITPGLK